MPMTEQERRRAATYEALVRSVQTDLFTAAAMRPPDSMVGVAPRVARLRQEMAEFERKLAEVYGADANDLEQAWQMWRDLLHHTCRVALRELEKQR